MSTSPGLPGMQQSYPRLRNRAPRPTGLRASGRAGTITARDWLVALDLYRCDFLPTAHVARALFFDGYDFAARRVIPGANPEGSLPAAERRLYKLREKGFLTSESQPALPPGYSTLWRLAPQTFAALRPPGSGHRLPRPMSPANTLHHLAVTDLYARLIGRVRRAGLRVDIQWNSERQQPERRFARRDGGAGYLRPDATVRIGDERYLLEVQRAESREPAERLARRVAAYAAYLASPDTPEEERHATVLFACEAARDADAVDRARDAHPGLYLVAGDPQEIEDLLHDEALAQRSSAEGVSA